MSETIKIDKKQRGDFAIRVFFISLIATMVSGSLGYIFNLLVHQGGYTNPISTFPVFVVLNFLGLALIGVVPAFIFALALTLYAYFLRALHFWWIVMVMALPAWKISAVFWDNSIYAGTSMCLSVALTVWLSVKYLPLGKT